MITAIESAIANYGQLVNNFNMVKELGRAISAGEHSFNLVPSLLEGVLENGRWLERVNPHTNEYIGLKPHEFRKLIESPFPEGLATDDATIRKFLKTPRLLDLYNRASVSERGGLQHETRAETGQFAVHNRNNITIVEPISIPLRDYSKEPQTGTSRGYALRRLARERPDLHARVIGGEITPHGAMVEAGFVDKSITIPSDPENAARRLARHFHGERLEALIRALESHR